MGRASNRKRAAATNRPASAPAPALAPLVPRSVEALGPAQVEAVQRLQRLEVERRDIERQLDDLALKSRRAGMPWAAIGWALGISSQAASQRYGKRL